MAIQVESTPRAWCAWTRPADADPFPCVEAANAHVHASSFLGVSTSITEYLVQDK